MDIKLQRLRELTRILAEASEAYYTKDSEIMTNQEFDKLQDELVALERELGFHLPESPTHRVGSEPSSKLPKERHKMPMQSLAKTKNLEELSDWLGGHDGVLSWKLDGLTLVLTYQNGSFQKAVTRGNGEIGEVVSHNRDRLVNIPQRIDHEGELVVRGEAVISYPEFERINSLIVEGEGKYKNPRNLCSGTVRQLEANRDEERNVRFVAFATVDSDKAYRSEDLANLANLGFEVVEHMLVNSGNVAEKALEFEKKIGENELPSDGLVLELNDIAYGKSLGSTSKFPRNAIALKWADEMAETVLREIEWSASRTGMINPIAVVDPVELEGTTVSRASLHNVSIMRDLMLGIGDTVKIYKANMIIPQIAENITKSATAEPPDYCPVCAAPTELKNSGGVFTLHCANPDCAAKHLKRFSHFVSQHGMNIEGLSEMTLEKFIGQGYIKEYADIYRLDRYAADITALDGFGQRSYALIRDAVEAARRTTAVQLLYALGIPRIGLANAKLIARAAEFDFEKIMRFDVHELLEIHGIGDIMATDFVEFFRDAKKMAEIRELLNEISFDEAEKERLVDVELKPLSGKVFVITGALSRYRNRDEMTADIEKHGGSVASAVSKNTDFLVNNDVASGSSKNKKAKELGIPIITEEDLIERIGGA